MLLSEILNLYKLAADPSKLTHHADTYANAPRVEDKPVTIVTGKGKSIVFPYFEVLNKGNKPTTLSRKLGVNHKVDSWKGDPKSFAWDRFPVQKKNYEALSSILQRKNLKFDYMWFITVTGSDSYSPKKYEIHWFIAVSGTPENPNFIWYKYGGYSPQAGQNWVYTAPQSGQNTKIQTSVFLSKKPAEQDRLASLTSDTLSTWKVMFSNIIWGRGTDGKRITRYFKVKAKTAGEARRTVKDKTDGDPEKYGFDGYIDRNPERIS